ncbi:MAG: porin family protein [Bacteroidales bacterium]
MIKPIVIVIGLFFLLGASLSAQQFKAGVKGGVSASQVSGDDLQGFNKPGIFLGIYTSLDINDRSRMTLEMSYVEKGSRKLAKPDKGIYTSYKLMLNYVEIPITYQYFFNPNFSVEAGPSFGILLNQSDNEEDENGTLSVRDPFDNYELAVNGGFNYYINEKWGGGVRYSQSVLPVREHSGGATYRLNRGQYISMIRFFAAYKF